MSYPTIVYKCPGDHHRPGGTYSYRSVADEDAMKEAKVCGWFKTLEEAVKGKVKEPEPEDDSPPTRAEIEQQAKELDISFNARTSDEKLLSRIDEALNVVD